MKLKTIKNLYFDSVEQNLKLRTYLLYQYLYNNYLKKEFDDKNIKSIKDKDIDSFVKNNNNLSTSTIKLLLTVLKNIFSFARKDLNIKGLCKIENKFKSEKSKVKALTLYEQQKI